MPPSGSYPRWMESSSQDLMYLGWGERQFGVEPVPLHSNGGWVYWVVTEGEILVEFTESSRRFGPGTGMITGPDLAFGFPKRGQMPAKILAWIWKNAPKHYAQLSPDSWDFLRFSRPDLDLLRELHRQTRYTCLNSDALTDPFLDQLHGLVDIVFTRARLQEHSHDLPDQQIRIARQWMLDHLNVPRPVEDLARYLNLSTVSLHRLFKDRLQESPGAHFRRLKMERAQELLQRGQHSVKWIAYELGYRHPGDFSRAYTTFRGHPPTEDLPA